MSEPVKYPRLVIPPGTLFSQSGERVTVTFFSEEDAASFMEWAEFIATRKPGKLSMDLSVEKVAKQ